VTVSKRRLTKPLQDPEGQGSNARVAIVTAAASGIGRAAVIALAGQAIRVIAVDIDRVGLAALAAALPPTSAGPIRTVIGSVLDSDAIADAVDMAQRSFGSVDVLVNVVGGSIPPGLEAPVSGIIDMTEEFWTAVLGYNLTSTFRCIKAVLPSMRAQGHGRIINVGSVAAYGLSDSSSMAYATAKAGLIAMTRRLGTELGPLGITTNLVAPGFTLSERGMRFVHSLPPERAAAMQSRTPLGRAGLPEDVAGAIVFLASDISAFINGSVIDVNGGFWLG
jgi:3-oxoacyl-[acyl-carrier protein] reductase